MQKKLIGCLSFSALMINTAFADCKFTFVNKSKAAVTLQGYFLENGEPLSEQSWLTVAPGSKIYQVRTGKRCNALYKHSGVMSTRVDLKNNSGYWNANKGFLFAADRSYSHYVGHYAKSDMESAVTLSNAVRVTRTDFKVYMNKTFYNTSICSL